MQRIDVFFAVLSVIVAGCVASYLWIFLYRPAAFRFSLARLKTLIWYKRVPGEIFFVFVLWGLGFMVFEAARSALWWMPGTVWIDGQYRPVSLPIALMIGFGSAGFIMSKMDEIAQRISETNSEI